MEQGVQESWKLRVTESICDWTVRRAQSVLQGHQYAEEVGGLCGVFNRGLTGPDHLDYNIENRLKRAAMEVQGCPVGDQDNNWDGR